MSDRYRRPHVDRLRVTFPDDARTYAVAENLTVEQAIHILSLNGQIRMMRARLSGEGTATVFLEYERTRDAVAILRQAAAVQP